MIRGRPRKRLGALALICLLLFAAGCGALPETPPPTGEIPLPTPAVQGGGLPELSRPTAPSLETLPEQQIPAGPAETAGSPDPASPDKPPETREAVDPASSDRPPQSALTGPSTPRPKICIDPGHYAGVNAIDDGLGFAEGDFTLEVALRLQAILRDTYGIESCLTRSGGTAVLGGYSDLELDQEHISLRGAYAAEQGCDFFMSIHTNANLEDANGCPTFDQPIGITKTVVLVNVPCGKSERWLAVANEIGTRLSRVNADLGLAESDSFQPASVGQIPAWSDEWNDSLNRPGAVLQRLRENEDYYGVLRGAAEVGVPGIIVEHGFHTVRRMREMAVNENLAETWAKADADAIAAALGLTAGN